jgi:hypothetical protein
MFGMQLKESKPEYGVQRRQPVDARDLLRVDPKDQAICQQFQFSMAHLTAYSVHWLTVWEIPSTYENVTVLNARLFPFKFTLAGFPEFPDAMCTNREILHLRPKYRGFATSDPRKGVFLSEKGREAAATVIEALGYPTFEGKPIKLTAVTEIHLLAKGRDRTRNPTQIVADCKGKLLYRRFTEGKFEETDIVHFLGLLSLYDHTPPSEVRKAFRQLRADALTTEDKEFLVFLDRVEERFSAYLNRADNK